MGKRQYPVVAILRATVAGRRVNAAAYGWTTRKLPRMKGCTRQK